MSFDLFAYRELKEIVPDCEDRYDQLERNMKLQDLYLTERFEEKQSEGFVGMMEGFLASLEDELMDFERLNIKEFKRRKKSLLICFISSSRMSRCLAVWMRSGIIVWMNMRHYLDVTLAKRNF